MTTLKAFQASLPHTTDTELNSDTYIVPLLVQTAGDMLGMDARAMSENLSPSAYNAQLCDGYRDLAICTATLLSYYGVEEIDPEIVESSKSRIALSVDAQVAIHTRVDRLYRAFRLDEVDHTRAEAQRLWTTLDTRCKVVTGKAFAQVLK